MSVRPASAWFCLTFECFIKSREYLILPAQVCSTVSLSELKLFDKFSVIEAQRIKVTRWLSAST